MKAVCISNKHHYLSNIYIIGEVYDYELTGWNIRKFMVFEIGDIIPRYLKDDEFDSMFMTLEEYRNQKIEEILK